MAPTRSRGRNWLAFALLAIIGIVPAFGIFAVIALGECLPRDGSPAMRACDAGKRFELSCLPVAVILIVVGAAWARRRGLGWIALGPVLLLNGVMASLVTAIASRIFLALS